MSDETRDYLPKRALPPVEEPLEKAGEGAFGEGGQLANARKRARIMIPAALALSVAVGLAFTALPKNAEGESLTAAPASAVLAERNANNVNRDFDRAGAESADPTPEAAIESPAASEEPLAPAADTQAAEDDAAPAVKAGSLTTSPAASPSAAQSAAATTTAAAGKMYATEGVNVRAAASASSARIGSVQAGDSVNTTGQTSNGFTQVNYDGQTGWVSSEFLSKTAPAASSSSSPSSSAASRTSTGAATTQSASRSCTPLSPAVQPRTEAVHQALCANFPWVTSYGGVRADWDVEHPSGRAIDAMTTNGDAIANWARANAGQYGITEVIWNQRIWTTQRASEGWRSMSDRGSATANHRDHVHITVR